MNMIVAFCKNRGMGYKNKLPWHLPRELKYFKNTTTLGNNNTVIMGRNTWESLKNKPLKDRKNIILSSTIKDNDIKDYNNTFVFPNYQLLNYEIDSMINNNEKIWLIGGNSIYDNYIKHPKLKYIYITCIQENFVTDVKFPKLPKHFQIVNSSKLFFENNLHYYHKLYKNENY